MDRADIERRLPVWRAFSGSFLDTQFDDDHHVTSARTIASTPFSLSELEMIFRRDIAPALAGNLRCVAGEWAGWHDDFLRERIARSRRNRLSARFRTLGFRGYIDEEWRKWAHAVTVARTGEG